jgi:hypothetical protein
VEDVDVIKYSAVEENIRLHLVNEDQVNEEQVNEQEDNEEEVNEEDVDVI